MCKQGTADSDSKLLNHVAPGDGNPCDDPPCALAMCKRASRGVSPIKAHCKGQCEEHAPVGSSRTSTPGRRRRTPGLCRPCPTKSPWRRRHRERFQTKPGLRVLNVSLRARSTKWRQTKLLRVPRLLNSAAPEPCCQAQRPGTSGAGASPTHWPGRSGQPRWTLHPTARPAARQARGQELDR